LQNAVERAFILSTEEIDFENLPEKIKSGAANNFGASRVESGNTTLEEVERRYILDVLSRANDDKTEAARVLGIDLSTLYRKLKRYEEI
jgi:DNA-binding NtrC family response regulator